MRMGIIFSILKGPRGMANKNKETESHNETLEFDDKKFYFFLQNDISSRATMIRIVTTTTNKEYLHQYN